jgi:hypothetical protein
MENVGNWFEENPWAMPESRRGWTHLEGNNGMDILFPEFGISCIANSPEASSSLRVRKSPPPLFPSG